MISDTHELGTGWGSAPEVLDALRGVTYPGMRHTRGDLEVLGVLDIRGGVVSAEIRKLYRGSHEG